MGGAAAAVVAGDVKVVIAESGHDLDLVLGHGAEGVVGTVRFRGRGGTVAVAALGRPRRRGSVPRDGERPCARQRG